MTPGGAWEAWAPILAALSAATLAVVLVVGSRSRIAHAAGLLGGAGAAWILARAHLPGDLPASGASSAPGLDPVAPGAAAALLVPIAVTAIGFVLHSHLEKD